MHAETPHVLLNGAPLRWHDGLDVSQALAHAGVDPQAVATALNGRFVARGQRALTLLQPGDSLTVFAAIVGG